MDIRQTANELMAAIANDKEEKGKEAALDLVVGVLTDIRRIADALEKIAGEGIRTS